MKRDKHSRLVKKLAADQGEAFTYFHFLSRVDDVVTKKLCFDCRKKVALFWYKSFRRWVAQF